MKAIMDAIERLSKTHAEHISQYGTGNEERLTGKHEVRPGEGCPPRAVCSRVVCPWTLAGISGPCQQQEVITALCPGTDLRHEHLPVWRCGSRRVDPHPAPRAAQGLRLPGGPTSRCQCESDSRGLPMTLLHCLTVLAGRCTHAACDA